MGAEAAMASRNFMIGAAVVVAAAVVSTIVLRMEPPAPAPLPKTVTPPSTSTPSVVKPTVTPSAPPPVATPPPAPTPPVATPAPSPPTSPPPPPVATPAPPPAAPPTKSADDATAGASMLTLTLPQDAKAGEPVDLHVTLGVLPARAQVHVRSVADGSTLATIYPFGRTAGEDAGTFVVSIPTTAAKDGKLEVKFEIEAGGATRPATTPDGATSIVKDAKLETAPGK